MIRGGTSLWDIGRTSGQGEGANAARAAKPALSPLRASLYIKAMLGNLYSSDVLTLASTLENGRLGAPDGTARKVSKLCGSEVEIDVAMDGERVADAALRIEACALGQASAALLLEQIRGATLAELTDARDGLRAMLKEDAEPPAGRFERLALLTGVRAYPARHQSVMLAWDAAVDAVAAARGSGE